MSTPSAGSGVGLGSAVDKTSSTATDSSGAPGSANPDGGSGGDANPSIVTGNDATDSGMRQKSDSQPIYVGETFYQMLFNSTTQIPLMMDVAPNGKLTLKLSLQMKRMSDPDWALLGFLGNDPSVDHSILLDFTPSESLMTHEQCIVDADTVTITAGAGQMRFFLIWNYDPTTWHLDPQIYCSVSDLTEAHNQVTGSKPLFGTMKLQKPNVTSQPSQTIVPGHSSPPPTYNHEQ